jgi:hypothetical protein
VVNVSHGCINVSAQNAQAYFESAIYGDPVEVTGSSVHRWRRCWRMALITGR